MLDVRRIWNNAKPTIMNRKLASCLLVLMAASAALWLWTRPGGSRPWDSGGKGAAATSALPHPLASASGKSSSPPDPAATPETSAGANPAPLDPSPQAAPAASPPSAKDRFAGAATLAERETGPAKTPGRFLRQRLIKADFKYPLLRIEEEYELVNGERRLVNQVASVADHVVVTPLPGITANVLLESLRHLGATLRRRMPASGLWLVSFPDADLDTVPHAISEIEKIGSLARYVEPDYVGHAEAVPDDTDFGQLWGMNNTGQSGGTLDADIDAPEAWDLNTGSSSVVVGVIDTGVDYTHPDLKDNIWINPGEIPGNGLDDDGNGYIDDVHGWNFNGDTNDPMDANGHGTHCAGIIGARGNNGIGVTGVCWRVSIMPLKWLDSKANGADSDAVEAVAYATSMGAVLTSNSWFIPSNSPQLQHLKQAIDAADTAGILFVASAGNDGFDNETVSHYPSNYTSPNIIAVAAITRQDQLDSLSNYGATTVDLAAPGIDIYSTTPGSLGNLYNPKSGTSMAAAHVAGACALLKASRPSLTHTEIRDIILRSTVPIPALAGKTVTGGRLNVCNALLGDNRVIAATGLAGLTTISNCVSINAAGLVAFSGITASGSGSFVADANGPRAVRPINGNSQMGTNLQLNDAGSIIARRGTFFFTQPPISVYVPNWGWVTIEPGYSESYDYVQSWAANGSGGMELIAEGRVRTAADTLQTNKVGPFAGVGWTVTNNNVGQVAFAADLGNGFTSNYAVATPKLDGFNTYSCTGIPFPMLADDGRMVFRSGSAATTPIVLLNYDFTAAETIASTGLGFTALGRMPGISDDGQYVAFYGDLSSAGAATLGTTAGPGIFLSYQTHQGRVIKRVVGLSGQGGTALFSALDGNQRVGVNSQSQDGKVLVAFAGTNSDGVKGVWAARFDPASPLAVRMMTVILQSDRIGGIGPWDEFRLADPVNTNDQIAFWAKSGAQQAVIRTTRPVIAVEQPAGSSVANGASKDFGSVPVGSATSLTFVIKNTGRDSLNLTGTKKVAVNGANAAEFTVTGPPVSPVTAPGSTTFTVRFAPTGAGGQRTATLGIECDDRANTPYLIVLTGTAIATLARFEIATISSPQAVDSAFAVTITAKDDRGNIMTSFGGTVDLTETGDGVGGIVTPARSDVFTAGVLSGQIVTLNKAGTEVTLTATKTGGSEIGISNPFTVLDHFKVWVAGASQTGFIQDPNSDGIANGLAWLLGAADPLTNIRSLLPEATAASGKLRLHFKCLKAERRGTAMLYVQRSTDLGQADPWSSPVAVPEAEGVTIINGIEFTVTDASGDYNDVVAVIPSSGGKVFGRLRATE